jgi:hypothetical protein
VLRDVQPHGAALERRPLGGRLELWAAEVGVGPREGACLGQHALRAAVAAVRAAAILAREANGKHFLLSNQEMGSRSKSLD